MSAMMTRECFGIIYSNLDPWKMVGSGGPSPPANGPTTTALRATILAHITLVDLAKSPTSKGRSTKSRLITYNCCPPRVAMFGVQRGEGAVQFARSVLNSCVMSREVH